MAGNRSRDIQIASLLLRVGLAAAFLYAAVASLRAPLEWIGFLPSIVTRLMSPTIAIRIIAVYELALAAWLISGRYVRYAALVAAVTLSGILLGNLNELIVTFRDVGLFFASLALFFLANDAL